VISQYIWLLKCGAHRLLMIRGVERMENSFLLFSAILNFKWKLLTVREVIAVAYQQ